MEGRRQMEVDNRMLTTYKFFTHKGVKIVLGKCRLMG
jgi:hypothetical protein